MKEENAQFYDLAAGVMNVLVLAVLLAALNQLNARMSRQESRIQALTTENHSLTTRLASSASTSPQRTADPRASLVDTCLLGKPESFPGDPQRYPDWSFKLKAYFGAIDGTRR